MLAICKQFFDALNQQGIRYCHWKSNEHLEEAVSGKTDLDVLVSPSDKDAFQVAMSTYDFKRILTQPDRRFPDLEDYLGFDTVSGRFVHLHVHYRLILGQKYIKNHHLPMEELFFSNLTQKLGVNIPCPELELICLIIRAHLKTDLVSLAKHAIKDMMGARYTAFPKDIEDELRVLHQTSDPEKFAALLRESGLPLSERQCNQFLDRFSKDKLHFYHIMLGHYRILHQLRPYKRNTGIGVYFTFFRLFVLNSALVRRIRSPKRKTLIGQGKVFSIVGADGSGKSSLIGDIDKWLSWKLSVSKYYYGIPKNWVSALNSLSITVLKKLGLRALASSVGDIFWIYVARYRKSVSDSASRDIEDGQVVITDRFPMKDFRTMEEPMDNPRIGASKRLFGKNLRELEERIYDEIQLPDRIIVLQVHIDELRRRKSDIALHKHELKAAAVNGITDEDPTTLVNANRPYEEVLLGVKSLIWQAL